MPQAEAWHFVPVIAGIVIIIAILLSTSDRMHLQFPINSTYTEHTYGLLKNIRLRSSIEQFPVSYEIINDANLNKYIDLLLDQHKNSDKAIRDCIERIPFTEQGQHFFRSLSVGWHNSFSITLIAHKKSNGDHKIIMAKLSKEMTMSLFYRLLPPISSILGMTSSEQQQLETIMTNLNQEKNKQIMENMMMFIMADNLQKRFDNVLDISFVEKK
jgi:hypothetical protein